MAGSDDAMGGSRRLRRPAPARLAGALRRRARGVVGETAAPPDMPAAGRVERRWRPRIDVRAIARAAGPAALARVSPVAFGLAAAIPVVISTIDAVRADWVPAGDDGIIATRGWDVLTGHTPLVGQYSEAGLVVHGQVMHSPGPMLYWLLALPTRFGPVTSIAVTMGVVNTVAIIGCVLLARRRGGTALMFLTAAGIALMCQSLPAEAFHDIWNPAAGLFPFLLLIFLGWSLACGERRLLPLTALVASYVVQTHLMYGPPTVVLLGVGLGGLGLGWLEWRRRGRGPRLGESDAAARSPAVAAVAGAGAVARGRIWPWALAASVVTLLCWTAPIADQIEHDPGNLSMIVNTIEHRGRGLGPTVGWNAIVRSIGARPWWLEAGRTEWSRKFDVGALPTSDGTYLHPSDGEVDSALAILAALAALALVGAFLRRRDLAAGALIGLGLCGALALEATSNPSTDLLAGTLGYTMWWGSQLGFFVWLILVWALWQGGAALLVPALRRVWAARPHRVARIARRRAIATAAGFVACLGVVTGAGVAVAAGERPDSHHLQYRSVRTLSTAIERLVPPGERVKLAVGNLNLGTQPMEPAIRFLLVRHGDRVLANGSFPRLGPYYELYRRRVSWIVLLTTDLRARPHMKLAARVSFDDAWGHEVLSAWARPAPSRSLLAARPAVTGASRR